MFVCDAVGLLFDSVPSIPQSTAVHSGHWWRRLPASVGLVINVQLFTFNCGSSSVCSRLFSCSTAELYTVCNKKFIFLVISILFVNEFKIAMLTHNILANSSILTFITLYFHIDLLVHCDV